MTTATQTCEVLLPGYTITHRIGAGGYAEVWRAEAPGGIQKAVKLVHGYDDDEFASQELKALERIKGVRHPFLLSLERFEIINGRLVILTELADISLDQRLRQCRAEGLTGIPREELLRYMSDAAEALDFLSQRHQLLHLDIKPENLLVLGDHIKVADFGLVKELATRTQNSLVSGMTPTYASPEMFDDNPSIQSDQYSLAIVYQEMLLGTLPFPGRTAAQLAKQHTQAEPQLASLPAEDRPVIARALAKQPTDRFPSCRAFVDALLRRAEVIPAATPIELPRSAPYSPPTTKPDPDDTRSPSFCTTLRRSPDEPPDPLELPDRPEVNVTQPVRRQATTADVPSVEPARAPVALEPEETVDVAVPEVNSQLGLEQPTLYVAIGGVGIQVLCKLRACAALDDSHEAVKAIALDTDRNELREACSSRWPRPMASEDTLHLPLRLPKSYDNSREILGWLSRRWLYNIPRSLETRGYRPLGRIALVDNSPRVFELLDQKLQELAAVAGSNDSAGQPRDTTLKVVLLAGTGGGTGAGMVIDVANAVKSLAAARSVQVELHGFLVCTCLAANKSSPLEAANTYSLLTELNHATTLGNLSNATPASQPGRFESPDAPFDSVYAVPTRACRDGEQADDVLEKVARYLALEGTPAARAALRSCRDAKTPREQARGRTLALKSFGYASLSDQKRELLGALTVDLAEAIKRHWLTNDDSADWERLMGEKLRADALATPIAATGVESDPPPTGRTTDDITPIGLRARFKEHLALEFTSEVLRQIQFQRESRDNFGRPLISDRDAQRIADAAQTVAASLAAGHKPDSSNLRSTESAAVRPLIVAGSRRVLRQAVEAFDPRRPEQFLPLDTIDELLQVECRNLLEESFAQPDFAAALTALVNLDAATSSMIERATPDLLQCGSDRRTIVFVPSEPSGSGAAEKLRTARPAAAVVTAGVDDATVISEGAGISPRSFALGLERVFPGIASAAQRLLTRVDVEWKNLL